MENNNQTKSLYQKFKDFNASKAGKIFNGVFTVCLLSSFVLYKTGMIDKWQKQDTSPVYLSDVSLITASVLGHDVSDQDIAKLVLGKYPQLKQVDQEIIDIIIVMLRMDDSDFDAYSKIAIKNGYASKEDIDTYKVVRKDIHKVYPGIAGTITLEEVLAAELTVSIDMTEETEVVQHDKPKTLLEQEQELEEYVAEANKLLDKMGKIHLREHDINELRFKTSQEDRDRFIKGVIYRYPTVEEEAQILANRKKEEERIKALKEEEERKEAEARKPVSDEELYAMLMEVNGFNMLSDEEQAIAMIIPRVTEMESYTLHSIISENPMLSSDLKVRFHSFAMVSYKRKGLPGSLSIDEAVSRIQNIINVILSGENTNNCDDESSLKLETTTDHEIYNSLKRSELFCSLSRQEKYLAIQLAYVPDDKYNDVLRKLIGDGLLPLDAIEAVSHFDHGLDIDTSNFSMDEFIMKIKSF